MTNEEAASIIADICPMSPLTTRTQEALRMAEAALRAQVWQPIETAPKDGIVVLVFSDQHIAMLGRIYPHNSIHAAKWNGEAWIVAVYQDLGPSVSGPPTHWMPLPSVPQGEVYDN